MGSIKMRPYVPNEPPYGPRLSKHEWERFRPVLTHLHSQGLSRQEIIRRARRDHGFGGTLAALNIRFRKWNLTTPRKDWSVHNDKTITDRSDDDGGDLSDNTERGHDERHPTELELSKELLDPFADNETYHIDNHVANSSDAELNSTMVFEQPVPQKSHDAHETSTKLEFLKSKRRINTSVGSYANMITSSEKEDERLTPENPLLRSPILGQRAWSRHSSGSSDTRSFRQEAKRLRGAREPADAHHAADDVANNSEKDVVSPNGIVDDVTDDFSPRAPARLVSYEATPPSRPIRSLTKSAAYAQPHPFRGRSRKNTYNDEKGQDQARRSPSTTRNGVDRTTVPDLPSLSASVSALYPPPPALTRGEYTVPSEPKHTDAQSDPQMNARFIGRDESRDRVYDSSKTAQPYLNATGAIDRLGYSFSNEGQQLRAYYRAASSGDEMSDASALKDDVPMVTEDELVTRERKYIFDNAKSEEEQENTQGYDEAEVQLEEAAEEQGMRDEEPMFEIAESVAEPSELVETQRRFVEEPNGDAEEEQVAEVSDYHPEMMTESADFAGEQREDAEEEQIEAEEIVQTGQRIAEPSTQEVSEVESVKMSGIRRLVLRGVRAGMRAGKRAVRKLWCF